MSEETRLPKTYDNEARQTMHDARVKAWEQDKELRERKRAEHEAKLKEMYDRRNPTPCPRIPFTRPDQRDASA